MLKGEDIATNEDLRNEESSVDDDSDVELNPRTLNNHPQVQAVSFSSSSSTSDSSHNSGTLNLIQDAFVSNVNESEEDKEEASITRESLCSPKNVFTRFKSSAKE